MKLIASILSFIILVLAANPCIDKLNDDVVQQHELDHQAKNNKEKNDSNHCSPFCTCQCCQTNFYVSSVFIETPVLPSTIVYTEITPCFKNIYLIDFFNPPRS